MLRDVAARLGGDPLAELLALLGGYALTPALKGIMALVTDERGWLRVRPPLVALTEERFAALEREIRAFRIDTKTD